MAQQAQQMTQIGKNGVHRTLRCAAAAAGNSCIQHCKSTSCSVSMHLYKKSQEATSSHRS